MKSIKRILAITCTLLLMFSLTAVQAMEAVAPLLARFSLNDMAVAYVYVNTTIEEAMAVFGTPPDGETITLEATGELQEIWYYDGLTLTFSSEGMLIGADVSSEAYVGPRGVQVGQTPQDVVGRFYMDENSSSAVLYTAGYVEAFDAQLPPCGFVRQYDDGTFSINYAAPAAPFGDDVIADPTNYVFENLALFTVTFDQNALATAFSWYLGPWAE